MKKEWVPAVPPHINQKEMAKRKSIMDFKLELTLNNAHHLHHLYQRGFLTQDLFFLRDMYNYQNMVLQWRK